MSNNSLYSQIKRELDKCVKIKVSPKIKFDGLKVKGSVKGENQIKLNLEIGIHSALSYLYEIAEKVLPEKIIDLINFPAQEFDNSEYEKSMRTLFYDAAGIPQYQRDKYEADIKAGRNLAQRPSSTSHVANQAHEWRTRWTPKTHTKHTGIGIKIESDFQKTTVQPEAGISEEDLKALFRFVKKHTEWLWNYGGKKGAKKERKRSNRRHQAIVKKMNAAEAYLCAINTGETQAENPTSHLSQQTGILLAGKQSIWYNLKKMTRWLIRRKRDIHSSRIPTYIILMERYIQLQKECIRDMFSLQLTKIANREDAHSLDKAISDAVNSIREILNTSNEKRSVLNALDCVRTFASEALLELSDVLIARQLLNEHPEESVKLANMILDAEDSQCKNSALVTSGLFANKQAANSAQSDEQEQIAEQGDQLTA